MANPISPLQKVMQDPYRLEISPDFALLKEIRKGSSDRLIIHIQDAHSNLSGQDNLAKTLDGIITKYGVSLVLVEGGAIDGTLDPLKDIVSPEATRRAARSLLIEGQIAGEEYLNLVSNHDMKIVGIEDMPLYFQSVENYASLAGQREATLRYLQIIQNAVDKLKNKLYPHKLLDYEKIDAQKFEERFSALLEQGDPERFPGIQRLKAVQDAERAIDFDLVNLEQAALIEDLQRRGASQEILELLARSSRFKDQRISQFTHFQKLFEIAEEKNVQLSQYPGLVAMMGYLKEFSEISLESVLEEWTRFEDETYVSLLPEEDQRIMRSIDRYLSLLNTAYRIQMSSKEFIFFKANEKDFATLSYLAFINRKLMDLGYFDDLVPYEDHLEQGGKALEAFYGSVSRRDEAFVKNAERIMEVEGQKVAVLIAGGYHTQHLAQLLGDKHHSLSVLAPHVTGETDQSRYEKLLLSSTVRYTQAPYHGIARLFAQKAGISAADPRVTAAQTYFDGLIAGRTGARVAGVQALEKLKDYEVAVSRPRLEGVIPNPKENAQRLNDKLGDPYRATKARKKLQGITFIRRQTGGKTVWAFHKTDLGKVKDLLGINVVVQALDKPKAGEYAVSQKGLWKIVTNPPGFARSLNAILGDPTSATEITKELQGIVFILRRMRTNIVWSFRKARLAKVRELINTKRLQQIKGGEYAISKPGLKQLHLKNPILTAKQLNDRLGDPESATEIEKKIEGVPFILRQSGSNIVWSIQKDDFSRIQELIGIQSLEKLRDDEHAVSQPGLKQFFINPTKAAKQLNDRLGDPETVSETVKQLQRISFTRRTRGSKVTWSFLKTDLVKVQAFLGNGMALEGFEELKADEYAVSRPGLSRVFLSPRYAAETLNSDPMLGDPRSSTELTKDLHGITFTRRKNRTQIVWAFKKQQAETVAHFLKLKKMDAFIALLSDELAFLPASDLDAAMTGGLKASIKKSAWPDYIQDPNTSTEPEVTIKRNGAQVTFYRRRQNRGFVWAFKVEDLPKVAQIQGARASLETLRADEYKVTQLGMRRLGFDSAPAVERLNELLGEPKNSETWKKTLGDVVFTLRKGKTAFFIFWSFLKADLKKVKRLLGHDIEPLKEDEHVAALIPLSRLLRSLQRAKVLMKLLGEPADDSGPTKVLNGVTFTLRQHGSQIVWSFKKTYLSKVKVAAGVDGIDDLKGGEHVVSPKGLDGLIISSDKISDANKLLGDPKTATELVKVSRGVAFTRRRHGNTIVWAIKRQDLPIFAEKFGLTVKTSNLNPGTNVESLHEDEYAVTTRGLNAVLLNPHSSGKRLVALLGEADASYELTKRAGGTEFTLRSHGSKFIWSFKKSDVTAVEALLGIGGLKKMQADEYVVSKTHLYPDIAKRLGDLLGAPKGSTKEFGAVTFTVRKQHANPRWTFKRSDLKNVAAALAVPEFELLKDRRFSRLEEVRSGEYGVTTDGLRGAIVHPEASSKELVELLGDVMAFDGMIKEMGGVVFAVRKSGRKIVWSFPRSDLDKIRNLLARPALADLKELKSGEYAVSASSLKGVVSYPAQRVKGLYALLGQPGADAVKTVEGVAFTLRRKRTRIVWSFKKEDLAKVETLLGVASLLKDDECSITLHGLERHVINPSEAARGINAFLGSDETEVVKALKGIVFTRRKFGTSLVWAIKKGDIEKLADNFGFKLRYSVLQPDEMAFLPNSDLSEMLSGGLKASIKGAAWPEYLGDPNTSDKTEILVDRNGVQVTFLRRKQNGGYVWAFKVEDLPKVAQIQGARASLEPLQIGEYSVTQMGLKGFGFDSARAAKRLNKLLGDPKRFKTTTKTLRGTVFTLRNSRTTVIWAFLKTDLEKVKKILGHDMEYLKADEYAASEPGLRGLWHNAIKNAKRLKELLGDPEDSKALHKVAGDVTFTRRRHGSATVWAFRKDDFKKVEALLGQENSIQGLLAPKKDEFVISGKGLKTLLSGRELVSPLNDALGDPESFSGETQTLGDVVFTRRNNVGHVVWVFSKADLGKIKALLNIEWVMLRPDSPKKDEYTVSPSGLKGLFINSQKAVKDLGKLLGEAASSPAPVKVLQGVTFTRRYNRTQMVWVFPKKDIGKVKTVVGMEENVEGVEALKDDEYGVTAMGLDDVLINPQKVSSRFYQFVGNPRDSKRIIADASGVTFTLRKSDFGTRIWAIKMADIKKFAVKFGYKLRGAKIADLGELGKDEYAVSEPGLRWILRSPTAAAQRLNGMLGDPRQSSVPIKKLETIPFTRRRKGPAAVWSFRRFDLDRVKGLISIQGDVQGIQAVKDDEYSITQHGLAEIITNAANAAQQLNSKDMLGDPVLSDENTKTFQGVAFTRRRNHTNIIWAFKKTSLSKVKDILGIQDLVDVGQDEYVVSADGLAKLFFSSRDISQRLKGKEMLGYPQNAVELTKTLQGITFTRRRNGPAAVWSFKKADLERLKELLGERDIENLKDDEHAVSQRGLANVLLNNSRAAYELNSKDMLGSPKISKELAKTLRGVIFNLRRNNPNLVWAFKKADLPKVKTIFGLDIEEVGDDEYTVSQKGLFGVMLNANIVAQQLNSAGMLGSPRTSPELTKELGDMVFTRRIRSTKVLWSFKKKDIDRLASAFGFELSISELQPDELAFIPSADVDTMMSQGLKASIKAAGWPDYLGNPNISKASVTTVDRNGVNVVFHRRKQNGGFVWAFKIDDLPKVAQIQGSRVDKGGQTNFEYHQKIFEANTVKIRQALTKMEGTVNANSIGRAAGLHFNAVRNRDWRQLVQDENDRRDREESARKRLRIFGNGASQGIREILKTLNGTITRLRIHEETGVSKSTLKKYDLNELVLEENKRRALQESGREPLKLLKKIEKAAENTAIKAPTRDMQSRIIDALKEMDGAIGPTLIAQHMGLKHATPIYKLDYRALVAAENVRRSSEEPERAPLHFHRSSLDVINNVLRSIEGSTLLKDIADKTELNDQTLLNHNWRALVAAENERREDEEPDRPLIDVGERQKKTADPESKIKEVLLRKQGIVNPIAIARESGVSAGSVSKRLTVLTDQENKRRLKDEPQRFLISVRGNKGQYDAAIRHALTKFSGALTGSALGLSSGYGKSFYDRIGLAKFIDEENARRTLESPPQAPIIYRALNLDPLNAVQEALGRWEGEIGMDRLAKEANVSAATLLSVDYRKLIDQENARRQTASGRSLIVFSQKQPKRNAGIAIQEALRKLEGPVTIPQLETAADVNYVTLYNYKIYDLIARENERRRKEDVGRPLIISPSSEVDFVGDDEYAVSINGLPSTIPNSHGVASFLNEALGDPTKSEESTKTLSAEDGQVFFIKRKNQGRLVWSFKREDSGNILKLLPVQNLRLDEYGVSTKGLSTIVNNPHFVATLINNSLGEARKSPHNSISYGKEGLEVTFIKRRVHNEHIWTFKKEEMSKVADLFGMMIELQADELAFLPSSHLETVMSEGLRPSMRSVAWPSDLGNPRTSKVNSMTVDHNGAQVTFRRRKQNGGFVWAFKVDDLEKVAQLQGSRAALELVGEDEYAVSVWGLDELVGTSWKLAQSMNRRLGAPAAATAPTTTLGDIVFTLRRNGNKPVWAFKKKDSDRIKQMFGIEDLELVSSDQHIVSSNGLKDIAHSQIAAQRLNHLLGAPKSTKVSTKVLGEVTFSRRLTRSTIVWAFAKKDFDKVKVILGLFEIEEIKEGERSVSMAGLSGLQTDSFALSKRLRELLQDPEKSPDPTKKIGEVVFTRRKNGSAMVWAFADGDLDKVGTLLGLKPVETVKESERLVTNPGLKGLPDPARLVKKLNELLGDPETAVGSTKTLGGVSFTPRRKSGRGRFIFWAFAESDLAKVKSLLGVTRPDVERLKEDEFFIAKRGLVGVFIAPAKIARQLNGLLGEPESSVELSKRLGEVQFVLRSSRGNIAWAFKKSDIARVQKILNTDANAVGLQEIGKGERAVSTSGMIGLGGYAIKLTKQINALLGHPESSSELTKTHGGVVFTRRSTGPHVVWTFLETDREKVRKFLGLEDLGDVRDDEYAVTNLGLKGVMLGTIQRTSELNALLGDPETVSGPTKTLSGVTFFRRQRKSYHFVWAFSKADAQKVIAILGVSGLEGLEELKEDEYAASSPQLKGLVPYPSEYARRLNELLGEARTSSELTKSLGGMTFTRRRNGVSVVWAFARTEIAQLAHALASQSTDFIPTLQPDELVYMPSTTLDDMFDSGVNRALRSAAWPADIQDPNVSQDPETTVERDGMKITFYRRKQIGGGFVWAFKAGDLPKVAQIQGSRANAASALVYQKLNAVYDVLSKINPGQTLLIGDVAAIMGADGTLPVGFALPGGHTLQEALSIAPGKDLSTANLYLMTFERREDRRIHLVFQITEKNKTQTDLFFFWDEHKEQLVSLGTREEQKQRDEEVKRLIEGEISVLFEENAILFTQRYLKDIKNILWGILGGKLEGKYDQRKIEELIDAKIVEMIEGVTGRKPTLQDVVADEKEPSHAEPKVFVQSPVMTQTQIISLAERLSMRINEDIIDEGQRAVASQQAKNFLKKLEELYFFRTYYSDNPDNFRGEEAKVSIEAVLTQEKVPPLVQEILKELLSEIAQSAELEHVLHEKGLRSTTRLGLYQLVAIDRMAKNKKMILADEMGLGKTLETIGTFLLSGENEMVVIGPKNALGRWMDDIGDHTDTEMEVYLLGDKEPSEKLKKNQKVAIKEIKDPLERNEFLLNQRPDHGKKRVILLNYELMPNLLKYMEKEGRAPPSIPFLALDEVHKIKNRSAQTSRAIFGDKDSKGAFQADYKILVSGTPLENDTIELLGYLKYISLGGQTAEERFFETIDPTQFAQIYSKLDLARLSQLHAYLTTRMIRRLKDDVLKGLPKKSFLIASLDPLSGTMTINGDAPVQLSGNYRKQAELYEQALENPAEFERQRVEMLPQSEDDEEENSDSARTTQLLRLEQVTLNPGIFHEEGDSIKFDAVRHLVQERMKQGKSVLIFTNYKSAAKSLQEQLDKEFGAAQVAYVDGSIKDTKGKPDRQTQIDRFQSKEASIMVATLGTMEVAVELTQADTIIFLNSPWKHSSLSQAIDRAHRYDSQGRNFEGKILEIVNLEFQHPVSIDELKAAVVRRKAILAEMLINGNLAPEVLAAFQEADKNILDAVRNADQSQETLTQYELSLMQQFRMLIGRILSTQDPELKKQLWAEAAEFYMAVLEHKSSYYANMASLDYLSSDKFPQLKDRKLRVLDLASGPSTLFRAYERKRAQFEAERRFSLQITDYDLTPQMLGLGVAREEGSQVLGALEDVDLAFAPGSFNLINLSYAFRYASHPAKLVRDVHQLLTEGDMFVVILPKTNRIPKQFFQSMREAGFDMVVGEGGKLQTRLDEEVYKKIFLQYGKEFADDVASETQADFSYFVAKKSTRTPIRGLDDEDFRLTRQVPPMTEEKLKKLKASGKFKIIPDNITVKGKVYRFDDLINSDGQEFLSMDARKLVSRISRISMLADQQAAIRGNERRAEDKRTAIDRTIQRKLGQLEEHLMAAVPTLEADDKTKLAGDLESLKTRNMVRQSFRGNRSDKVDAMIALLGARVALEPVTEAEYTVSPNGLRDVYTHSDSVSKMINQRLDRLAKGKLQVEVTEGDDRVLFSRKRAYSHPVWSFLRTDADKVPSIIGFEDLKEDEYAVSGVGLTGLYADPYRLALRIDPELGDAETSERIHRSLGKGVHRVDFVRRKFGIRMVWAFKKADAPKFEKHFGIQDVDELDKDEYVISVAGLDGVYPNFTAAAKKINSQLGDRERSKGASKTVAGIVFLKKRVGPRVVWTFKKTDVDRVADAFGIERLEVLHEDEWGVSANALKGVLTDKFATSQKINAALGDPSSFAGLVATYGVGAKQVTFSRRKINWTTVWSFKRKDTDKVATLFQVKKKEELGDEDYAVAEGSLNGVYIGFKRVVIQIIQALGDPIDSAESVKTLGDGEGKVTFTRKWNHSRAVWSFKKSDSAKVGKLFGVDGLQNLKDDERKVSTDGFMSIYKNAQVGAKRANDALGDPELSPVFERVFGEGTGQVIFRIRKSGPAKVWAFEKKDIDKVAALFGLSPKPAQTEIAPALAPDEMSLMPSPDLGNMLNSRVKSSFRNVVWPEYLEDPATSSQSEIIVARNNVTVVFYRRTNSGLPIWAFKIGDLDNVSKLSGARVVEPSTETQSILKIHQVRHFPDVVVTTMPAFSSLSLVTSRGILPVAVSSTQIAVFRSAQMEGTRSFQLLRPEDGFSPVEEQELRFTREEIRRSAQARVVTPAEPIVVQETGSPTIDPQVLMARDSHEMKDAVTRQSLRRLVQNLIHDQHVELFLSSREQDEKEMLRQLKKLEAEIERLNSGGQYKLYIYPRFVDEGGREVLVQGFSSQPTPSGIQPKRAYLGLLDQGLLDTAVQNTGSYLPMDRASTQTGEVQALPYIQSMRTLIVSTVDEAMAAQLLESLFASEVDVDKATVKIIREPYHIAGITVDTYQQKGLIVLGARLEAELYEAFVSAISVGRSA